MTFQFLLAMMALCTYVRAEKKCTDDANCLYSYAGKLSADCSSRNLVIPPCFNITFELEAINLRHNRLNRVPDNMPVNIEFLDLSYNIIKDELVFLQNYTRLRHLNLDQIQMNYASFHRQVTELPNLQFMSLKQNDQHLSSYPRNLFAGFGSLYHLRIDGLPDGNFGDMFPNSEVKTLKILDVSGYDGFCKISRLKASVFAKFNLTHLNLSQCDLL